MQVINDNSGTYRSLTKSFRAVIRNEGFRGLYQGMSPALLAASGSWGGYFFFYEQSKARKKAAIVEGSLGTADIVSTTLQHCLNYSLHNYIMFYNHISSILQLYFTCIIRILSLYYTYMYSWHREWRQAW